MDIKAIICDIEGTTTSISFVKDILFKIAAEKSKIFLSENFDELKTIIDELYNLSLEDNFKLKHDSSNREKYVEAIDEYVQHLINTDRKGKPLKDLQGKIWRYAYENNLIKGHVYDDVAMNFKKWTEKGLKLYIYSSGSVEAQKLIFGYSLSGDLTPYLSGYFDTNVGLKQKAASYQNILDAIKLKGENVLFLSDIPNEVFAARTAKINSILLDRPGNASISEEIRAQFKVVKNFDEIEF